MAHLYSREYLCELFAQMHECSRSDFRPSIYTAIIRANVRGVIRRSREFAGNKCY